MTIQSGTDQSTRMPETADYKMLYQQLKMKHQFMLSQVSHEIRNPVTLINSFMQLLEGRHPELIQDNYWQKIMENMDFLKSLLNELSAFNNSEKLNLQNSNIYNTFCEVIESVTPALNERHITIDLQKLSPIPVIKADGIKLRQLFLNLIRNASDAIETEGNSAFVSADDAPADRQTETGTFLFMRDKRLKQVVLIFRRNTVTGIRYREDDGFAV